MCLLGFGGVVLLRLKTSILRRYVLVTSHPRHRLVVLLSSMINQKPNLVTLWVKSTVNVFILFCCTFSDPRHC